MLETHISWVLLAGDYAYKIKKPVNLGFLDFSTLERAAATARRSCASTAAPRPDLYLEVVPIGRQPRPTAASAARDARSSTRCACAASRRTRCSTAWRAAAR